MSKLAKGMAVSTLAAGVMVLASASPVSADAYRKDYKMPHYGNFSVNALQFNERYDKSKKLFYSVKQEEKKHDSERLSYNNQQHRFDNKNKHYGKDKHHKDTCRNDDHKKYDKWGQHGKWNQHGKKMLWNDRYDDNCKQHGKHKQYGGGYGGGYGNSVVINHSKDTSFYKNYEEKKALQQRESYAADYNQSSNRANFGGKHGGHANLASHHVSASVKKNFEHSYAASVKAEVAHSSSVNTNVSLNNYGPKGGHVNRVSAYENVNNYSKVEAAVSEYVKQDSSVNYSASTANANLGGKYGGANFASTNVNYSADSSYEASKTVQYSAEESSSYSSGVNTLSASSGRGW